MNRNAAGIGRPTGCDARCTTIVGAENAQEEGAMQSPVVRELGLRAELVAEIGSNNGTGETNPTQVAV